MKFNRHFFGFLSLLLFTLSFAACSDSSSGTGTSGTADECTENPSSPNCVTDEDAE